MNQSSTPNWVSRLCTEVQNGQFPTGLTEERFNDVLKWLLEREFIVGKSISDAMLQAYDSEDNARQNTFLALDDYLFILSDDSPFAILGLKGNSDMAVVKARYRRLIQLYHPDRGLAEANGLSDRAEKINQSYDRIKSGNYAPESELRPAYRNTPRTSMADRPAPTNTVYRAQASDSIRLALGSSKKLTLIVMSVLFLSAILLIYTVYNNNRPIDYSGYNESIDTNEQEVPKVIAEAVENPVDADQKQPSENNEDVAIQDTEATKDPSLEQQQAYVDVDVEEDILQLSLDSEPQTQSSSLRGAQISLSDSSVPEAKPNPKNNPGGLYSEMLSQAETDLANLRPTPKTASTDPAPDVSDSTGPTEKVPDTKATSNIQQVNEPALSPPVQTPVPVPAVLPQAKAANKPGSKPEVVPAAPVSPNVSEPKPVPANEPAVVDIKIEMAKNAQLVKVLSTPVAPVAKGGAVVVAAPRAIEMLTPKDRQQAISALKGYVNGMLAGNVSRSLKHMDNIVQVDGEPNNKQQLRQSYSHWVDEAIDRTFKIQVRDVIAHDGRVRITSDANIRFHYTTRKSMGYHGPMTFDVQPTQFGGRIVAIRYE